MDSERGALVPLAKGFRLIALKFDVGGVSFREQMGDGARRSMRMEAHSGK